MERFALKIDANRRADVHKLCRLCGIDHPDKQRIIVKQPQPQPGADDEPDLCRKIQECVGIRVMSNDQMPQTVCSLCADRVADIYEYRLMCVATQLQTRQLLKLPEIVGKAGGKKQKLKQNGESILGYEETERPPNVSAKPSTITAIPAKTTTATSAKVASTATPASGRSAAASKAASAAAAKATNNSAAKQATASPAPAKPSSSSTTSKAGAKTAAQQQPMVQISMAGSRNSSWLSAAGGAAAGSTGSAGSVGSAGSIVDNDLLVPMAVAKAPAPSKAAKRKRDNSEIYAPGASQLKIPKKEELSADEPTVWCRVCRIGQADNNHLQEHMRSAHSPSVHRFGCSSCQLVFDSLVDQKTHHIWHTRTKLPYTCVACGKQSAKLSSLPYHTQQCLTARSAAPAGPGATGFNRRCDDIGCAQCGRKFQTLNLYDWHGCFMRNNGQCRRCGRRFVRKAMLLRHTVKCDAVREEREVAATAPEPPKTAAASSQPSPAVANEHRVFACKSTTKSAQAKRRAVKMEPETILECHEEPLLSPVSLAASAQRTPPPAAQPPPLEADYDTHSADENNSHSDSHYEPAHHADHDADDSDDDGRRPVQLPRSVKQEPRTTVIAAADGDYDVLIVEDHRSQAIVVVDESPQKAAPLLLLQHIKAEPGTAASAKRRLQPLNVKREARDEADADDEDIYDGHRDADDDDEEEDAADSQLPRIKLEPMSPGKKRPAPSKPICMSKLRAKIKRERSDRDEADAAEDDICDGYALAAAEETAAAAAATAAASAAPIRLRIKREPGTAEAADAANAVESQGNEEAETETPAAPILLRIKKEPHATPQPILLRIKREPGTTEPPTDPDDRDEATDVVRIKQEPGTAALSERDEADASEEDICDGYAEDRLGAVQVKQEQQQQPLVAVKLEPGVQRQQQQQQQQPPIRPIRLKISKQHGTLNARLVANVVDTSADKMHARLLAKIRQELQQRAPAQSAEDAAAEAAEAAEAAQHLPPTPDTLPIIAGVTSGSHSPQPAAAANNRPDAAMLLRIKAERMSVDEQRDEAPSDEEEEEADANEERQQSIATFVNPFALSREAPTAAEPTAIIPREVAEPVAVTSSHPDAAQIGQTSMATFVNPFAVSREPDVNPASTEEPVAVISSDPEPAGGEQMSVATFVNPFAIANNVGETIAVTNADAQPTEGERALPIEQTSVASFVNPFAIPPLVEEASTATSPVPEPAAGERSLPIEQSSMATFVNPFAIPPVVEETSTVTNPDSEPAAGERSLPIEQSSMATFVNPFAIPNDIEETIAVANPHPEPAENEQVSTATFVNPFAVFQEAADVAESAAIIPPSVEIAATVANPPPEAGPVEAAQSEPSSAEVPRRSEEDAMETEASEHRD